MQAEPKIMERPTADSTHNTRSSSEGSGGYLALEDYPFWQVAHCAECLQGPLVVQEPHGGRRQLIDGYNLTSCGHLICSKCLQARQNKFSTDTPPCSYCNSIIAHVRIISTDECRRDRFFADYFRPPNELSEAAKRAHSTQMEILSDVMLAYKSGYHQIRATLEKAKREQEELRAIKRDYEHLKRETHNLRVQLFNNHHHHHQQQQISAHVASGPPAVTDENHNAFVVGRTTPILRPSSAPLYPAGYMAQSANATLAADRASRPGYAEASLAAYLPSVNSLRDAASGSEGHQSGIEVTIRSPGKAGPVDDLWASDEEGDMERDAEFAVSKQHLGYLGSRRTSLSPGTSVRSGHNGEPGRRTQEGAHQEQARDPAGAAYQPMPQPVRSESRQIVHQPPSLVKTSHTVRIPTENPPAHSNPAPYIYEDENYGLSPSAGSLGYPSVVSGATLAFRSSTASVRRPMAPLERTGLTTGVASKLYRPFKFPGPAPRLDQGQSAYGSPGRARSGILGNAARNWPY